MPTISAWVVLKPVKQEVCGGHLCVGRRTILSPGEPRVRTYGKAYSHDKPSIIHLCLKCARANNEPKIQRALADAGLEAGSIPWR